MSENAYDWKSFATLESHPVRILDFSVLRKFPLTFADRFRGVKFLYKRKKRKRKRKW